MVRARSGRPDSQVLPPDGPARRSVCLVTEQERQSAQGTTAVRAVLTSYSIRAQHLTTPYLAYRDSFWPDKTGTRWTQTRCGAGQNGKGARKEGHWHSNRMSRIHEAMPSRIRGTADPMGAPHRACAPHGVASRFAACPQLPHTALSPPLHTCAGCLVRTNSAACRVASDPRTVARNARAAGRRMSARRTRIHSSAHSLTHVHASRRSAPADV